MLQPTELAYFYRSTLVEQNQIRSDYIITATSLGLSEQEAERLFGAIFLGTHNGVDLGGFNYSCGLFQFNDDTFVLSLVRRAPRLNRGYPYPEYYGIRLPLEYLRQYEGDIISLCNNTLIPRLNDFPEFPHRTYDMDPLKAPPPASLSPEALAEYRQGLSRFPLFDSTETIYLLLSGLLYGQVLLLDAPSVEEQLALAQGIVTLLPAPMRPTLTFATDVFDSARCSARLKFLFAGAKGTPGEQDLLVMRWNGEVLIRADWLDSSYAREIADLWGKGPEELNSFIDGVASCIDHAVCLIDAQLVEDAWIDYQLAEAFKPDLARERLSQRGRLKPELAEQYSRALLQWAIENKNSEYATFLREHHYLNEFGEVLQPLVDSLLNEAEARVSAGFIHNMLCELFADDKANAVWKKTLAEATIHHIETLLAMPDEAGKFTHSLTQKCTSQRLRDTWQEMLAEAKPEGWIGWLKNSLPAQVQLLNLYITLGQYKESLEALAALVKGADEQRLARVLKALEAFNPSPLGDRAPGYSASLRKAELSPKISSYLRLRLYQSHNGPALAREVVSDWAEGHRSPTLELIRDLLTTLWSDDRFGDLLNLILEWIRREPDRAEKSQRLSSINEHMAYLQFKYSPVGRLVGCAPDRLAFLRPLSSGPEFLQVLQECDAAFEAAAEDETQQVVDRIQEFTTTLNEGEREEIYTCLNDLYRSLEAIFRTDEARPGAPLLGKLFRRGSYDAPPDSSLASLRQWLYEIMRMLEASGAPK